MANTKRIHPVIEAFMRREALPGAIANTRTDGTRLTLHGNIIAEWTSPESFYITTAGYNTILTRHRLNQLPGVCVTSVAGSRGGRGGTLYLNGHLWRDGLALRPENYPPSTPVHPPLTPLQPCF